MKPVPQGKNVEDLTGPHTILLFEDTCADWMTCALGALSQSLVVATSYATLGIDAVGEAIKASNITTVVTNRKNVDRVAGLKKQCRPYKRSSTRSSTSRRKTKVLLLVCRRA